MPGLAAKPIIDVLVTVESMADEARYLPHLVGAGYQLRVRELGHRLFARSTSVSTSTSCSTTTTTRRRPTSSCATGSAGAR
ncbi:MAG: hypothetical protein QOD31_24 [Pseudonocardiales bacterium]|nr:hypothetical protein [Pseudonocardiales bacterium]